MKNPCIFFCFISCYNSFFLSFSLFAAVFLISPINFGLTKRGHNEKVVSPFGRLLLLLFSHCIFSRIPFCLATPIIVVNHIHHFLLSFYSWKINKITPFKKFSCWWYSFFFNLIVQRFWTFQYVSLLYLFLTISPSIASRNSMACIIQCLLALEFLLLPTLFPLHFMAQGR